MARAGVVASCLGLTACGVLNPMDVSTPTRLFVPQAPNTPVSAASAPSPMGDSCDPGPEYDGKLAAAICEADALRLRLMGRAAEVTNNAVNFNAATWPLGAAILGYRLKHPGTSLLVPAAVATGLYGFLNAGIPGRDAVHRDAAKALSCAIVGAGGEVYLTRELRRGGALAAILREPVGLPEALTDLAEQIRAFEQAASLLNLGGRGRTAAATGDSIVRALGGGSGGGVGASASARQARATIEQYIAMRLRLAADVKADGERMLALIDGGSESQLRAAVTHILSVHQEALAKNAPALRDPAEEGKKIFATLNGMAQAQSGATPPSGAVALPAGVDPAEARLPGSVTDGLDDRAFGAWQKFVVGQNLPLQTTMNHVRRWLTEHDRRRAQVGRTQLALGCPIDTVVASSAGANADRERRSANPVGGGTSNVTPLPAAGASK